MYKFTCQVHGASRVKRIPAFKLYIADFSNNAEDLSGAVHRAMLRFRNKLVKKYGNIAKSWVVRCNLITSY